mmetsp:Transcript_45607/g.74344  ORF Transcript_45607/g.74344 Transcript_45607/m.74344 type:complete len:83 (-) Transcript_45607:705-953(-)
MAVERRKGRRGSKGENWHPSPEKKGKKGKRSKEDHGPTELMHEIWASSYAMVCCGGMGREVLGWIKTDSSPPMPCDSRPQHS